VSWKRSLVLALLVACSKDTREQAQEIVDDTSLATPDALARAAALIYPTGKVWAEPRGDKWRVFVIVGSTKKAYVDKGIIKIHEYVDGKQFDKDYTLLAVGLKRGLEEVLVAERYQVDVEGRVVVALDPRRIKTAGQAMQSFATWEPADLEKAKPYDTIVNQGL
jgi:hypothetical protein